MRREVGGEGGFGVPLSPMGALIDVPLLPRQRTEDFGTWGHSGDTQELLGESFGEMKG